MIKLENLDYAIAKTLEVHPDFRPHMGPILLSQIEEGINLIRFTQRDGARASLVGMEPDDVLAYVVYEAIKIYNAASFFYFNDNKIKSMQTTGEKMKYLTEVFPYFGDLQSMMNILADKETNISLYLKGNGHELLCLITAVLNTRFQNNAPYKKYIDSYGNTNTITPSGEKINLFAKVDNDIEKASLATNIQVNHGAINKCIGDLMSGVQLKNKRNEYVLEGTLFATQDIGNFRRNQEDTTVILTHPENSKFKFLAVSDGMGGVDYGDKASLYMIQNISKWFMELPADIYYCPEELQAAFNKRISEISNEVYNLYNADYNRIVSGATFVGALVTEEKTIVSSVGDSRAYVLSFPELHLITKDESYVWPPSKEAKDMSPEELDELRFHKKNNTITRCIGQEHQGKIQSHMLDTSAYDRLLLFSDGITDVLPTNRIKFLALNTPVKDLTNAFVNEALLYDAVRSQGETDIYNARVNAGKDNATAAAYIRR